MALLGILLMNIPVFALPDYYSEPFRSDPHNIHFWFRLVINIFFEGKMRALFGMLFGAGVLLFIANKEKDGKTVHWLFYRRTLLLVLFGLFQAHVMLWLGEILYCYGVCGMIVYLFRKVNPRVLVLAVPLVGLIDFGLGVRQYQVFREERTAGVPARVEPVVARAFLVRPGRVAVARAHVRRAAADAAGRDGFDFRGPALTAALEHRTLL